MYMCMELVYFNQRKAFYTKGLAKKRLKISRRHLWIVVITISTEFPSRKNETQGQKDRCKSDPTLRKDFSNLNLFSEPFDP